MALDVTEETSGSVSLVSTPPLSAKNSPVEPACRYAFFSNESQRLTKQAFALCSTNEALLDALDQAINLAGKYPNVAFLASRGRSCYIAYYHQIFYYDVRTHELQELPMSLELQKDIQPLKTAFFLYQASNYSKLLH